jgi:hypothetical protein
MRRESSTVVVVTGDVGEDLAGLARSANVSVARAPVAGPKAGAERRGRSRGADAGSGAAARMAGRGRGAA